MCKEWRKKTCATCCVKQNQRVTEMKRHLYVSFIPSRLKFISMQRVTVCKEPGTGETSGRQSSTLESERGNVSRVCVYVGEGARETERDTDTVYLSSNRLTFCGMALFDPAFQSKQSVRAVHNHHALSFCLSACIWVLNVMSEARLACKSVLFHFTSLKSPKYCQVEFLGALPMLCLK